MAYRPIPVTKAAPRSILVYGAPDAGKTFLCAGIPDALYIDADRNSTATLAAVGSATRTVFQVDGISDLIDLLRMVKTGATTRPVAAVVLDGGTRFQQYDYLDIFTRPGNKRDPRQNFGELLVDGLSLFRLAQDLPQQFVYTAHSRLEEDPRDGLTKRVPAIMGQLGDSIAGFFEIICYLAVVKGLSGYVHRAHFAPSSSYIARDNTRTLPATIDLPDGVPGWSTLAAYWTPKHSDEGATNT